MIADLTMRPAEAAPFPYYDAATVARLLDMPGCIAAMRVAMRDFSTASRDQPLRAISEVAPGQLFAVMPGVLDAPGGFGAKLISAFDDPARPGRSRHRGVVALFDHADGSIACLGDAEEITHIRTAASTAAATDELARADACRLAVFGTGLQAKAHAAAIALVRPLDRITLWGRSIESARQAAAQVARITGVATVATVDGRAAAADADIVCTATSATTPVLLGEWIMPGTHVNAVGSSFAGPVEIDTPLVARSRYIVDSRRSALAAAAELLVAKAAGAVGDDHIAGEIGEVTAGRVAGRRDADEVTLYKSLGHIVQDLAALAYIHAKATARSETTQ